LTFRHCRPIGRAVRHLSVRVGEEMAPPRQKDFFVRNYW
jgi:hypothetical protein